MEAGSFSFEPVRVDAAVLALEAVRSLEPLAAARQVGLVRVPEAAEGFWIRVDPDRFLQILVNLLANAVKFSPSPGEVRVGLEREGSAVAVAVQDQGPGIPEAFRDRIFGKFQQAERKASGTGLGLAIARQLTEAMGGSIGFESEEGRGACFRVRFPEDAG
jgi:signal transduction histidine kinase